MSAYIVPMATIEVLAVAPLDLAAPGTNHHPFFYYAKGMPTFTESYVRGQVWGNMSSFEEFSEEYKRTVTRIADANRIGRLLMAANRDSLNHRYAEDEIERDFSASRIVGFDPIALLGVMAGFIYQACEHPEWRGSEAQLYLEALSALCVKRLTDVHDTAWTIEDVNEARLPEFKGRNVVSLMGMIEDGKA